VKAPGRLLVRHPLKVAKHERGAVLLGQPGQLLVEHRGDIVLVRRRRRQGGEESYLVLLRLAPDLARSQVAGDAGGDSVQPVGEEVRVPDDPGLPGQDEEGRLKGVLGVLRRPQDAPANAQHERAVPLDQGREGRLVAQGREPMQELSVGR
jgi:hypothetical protein